LPWKIYEEDPCWIPPLLKEMKFLLLTELDKKVNVS